MAGNRAARFRNQDFLKIPVSQYLLSYQFYRSRICTGMGNKNAGSIYICSPVQTIPHIRHTGFLERTAELLAYAHFAISYFDARLQMEQ